MANNHQTSMTRGSLAVREREELITQWRAEGQTFAEIGRRLGITRQSATRIWQRVADRTPVASVRQYRENDKALIDTAIRSLIGIYGSPKSTQKDKVEAWNSICRWTERRAKLLGLDATVKRELTVLNEDTVDAAIRALSGQMMLQASEAGIELSELER